MELNTQKFLYIIIFIIFLKKSIKEFDQKTILDKLILNLNINYFIYLV